MKQKAERDCMAAKYYQYAMQSSKHALSWLLGYQGCKRTCKEAGEQSNEQI